MTSDLSRRRRSADRPSGAVEPGLWVGTGPLSASVSSAAWCTMTRANHTPGVGGFGSGSATRGTLTSGGVKDPQHMLNAFPARFRMTRRCSLLTIFGHELDDFRALRR